jgi:hypothetical protein
VRPGWGGVEIGPPLIDVVYERRQRPLIGVTTMKYMLLFCGDAEYNKQWDSFPQEVKDEYMGKLGQWFGQHADKLEVTHQLESPSTAKTVRGDNGNRTVTDGPFIEAKEIIGGFAVFDVADEAEALQLAKEWPAGGTVEVRPVVPR